MTEKVRHKCTETAVAEEDRGLKKKIMDNLDREEPREGNWQFYCNQTSLAGEGWLLKISEYLMCPHG